jgi:hypothetical protein
MMVKACMGSAPQVQEAHRGVSCLMEHTKCRVIGNPIGNERILRPTIIIIITAHDRAAQ